MSLETTLFFFFQAEDGIRALVRSRGLGDVYKRQAHIHARFAIDIARVVLAELGLQQHVRVQFDHIDTVSYTHLTLPTSDLV